jgi:HK97 family phage portal protein
MNKYLAMIGGFFRIGSGALSVSSGTQTGTPSTSLIEDVPSTGIDGALQISAVWRSVEILSKLIATLPLMVYENKNGLRQLARDSNLWQLLHESPNSRMTTVEFWTAILLNLLFRGQGYARIQRNERTGEAEALWPMPSDQVEMRVLDDGSEVYLYRVGSDMAVLAAENVFHLKEMGNGVIGWSRLDYMRATLGESKNAQTSANKLFANGGKPTGILMVDNVLNKEQRAAIQNNFAEMATGTTSRLYVLEANMKYEQINLSPEDMQLLTTRQFTVQEIGRWFGVPSILLNQTEGTTTLGSSSADIIETFYKLTIRPMVINIEAALRKRVMNSGQRARYTVEYSMDALLRASLKDRMEIYAKAVQNGLKNRNECRQLENDAPFDGGEIYTAQSNLLPMNMLGKVKPTGGSSGTQDPIAN